MARGEAQWRRRVRAVRRVQKHVDGVAIARALANDPILILADEPTGALDSRTSVEVMGLFQQLNDKGITIVVVTHESDVAAFTRRILSFRDGRLVSDSPVPSPRRAAEVLSRLSPVGSAA